jgi:hypothetical protein
VPDENFEALGSIRLTVDEGEAQKVAEEVARRVRNELAGAGGGGDSPGTAAPRNIPERTGASPPSGGGGGGVTSGGGGDGGGNTTNRNTVLLPGRIPRSIPELGEAAKQTGEAFRAIKSGGFKAAGMGGLALGAIGVGAAAGLVTIIRRAMDSSRLLSDISRGAQVNAQFALAQSITNIGQLRRDILSSRRTGATTLFRARSLDSLQTTLEPIRSLFANARNLLFGAISQAIEQLAIRIPIARAIIEISKFLDDQAKSTTPAAIAANLKGIAGLGPGDTIAAQFILGAIGGGLNPAGGTPTPPTNRSGPFQFTPTVTF